MGITEDRAVTQTRFCFLCSGPGTQTWDGDNRRICTKCRRLLQTWNVHRAARPKRKRTDKKNSESYKQKRLVFLKENPICWVGLLVFKTFEKANVVHHRKGRGEFYLDESTWIPTTKHGDIWIHSNKFRARELGLLL